MRAKIELADSVEERLGKILRKNVLGWVSSEA
jgi:hypothetical protein